MAVVYQESPEGAEVAERCVDVEPDHQRLYRADRRNGHIVAAPRRKDEPGSLLAGRRAYHDVGGRIVRIAIHGIRAIELPRCRKSDVQDFETAEDAAQQVLRSFPDREAESRCGLGRASCADTRPAAPFFTFSVAE